MPLKTDNSGNDALRGRLTRSSYDAIVIGAGPNGLAAAITLAQRGWSVALLEAASAPGGGCRSEALTLPGFVHDVGSAIHPLGAGSPFFRTLSLEKYGLEWVHPVSPLAHPFDEAEAGAAVLETSLEETCDGLGERDGKAYRRLMAPLLEETGGENAVDRLSRLLLFASPPATRDLLGLPVADIIRLGAFAVRSARGAADALFVGSRARGLFAGLAAHSLLPLEQGPSATVALALAAAGHAFGWPFPKGGAQRLVDALVACFRDLGGELITDARVTSLDDLPPARAILCDLSPRSLVAIAGNRLPRGYRRLLEDFRYGPGAFKVDWALDGPIPWKRSAAACARAGTVHLGSTFGEIAEGERAVARGEHPERPYVLLAQQTLFDPSRAPVGGHTVWAYCHVPSGSTLDMTGRIENQIERYAPGFKERILAKNVLSPGALERGNPNLVGGDVGGGVFDWRQILFRPTPRAIPFTTPVPGLFLCSASTPPGPGVHGMCGYWAGLVASRRA
ncbi:MAG: NAD(P)/FAD-dependent oxidoreductase [Cytophagales bacterium]|nr:NAD(P)/FAD-dependent oxidoreductase [Armatimonadota bacterium]